MSCLKIQAWLASSQGKWEEVEQLYRQALGIVRTALGEQHVLYPISLGDLGSSLRAQNNLAEAGPMLRDDVRERAAGRSPQRRQARPADLRLRARDRGQPA